MHKYILKLSYFVKIGNKIYTTLESYPCCSKCVFGLVNTHFLPPNKISVNINVLCSFVQYHEEYHECLMRIFQEPNCVVCYNYITILNKYT